MEDRHKPLRELPFDVGCRRCAYQKLHPPANPHFRL
jgi:hypothetical protein